jgi:hypothetical protein
MIAALFAAVTLAGATPAPQVLPVSGVTHFTDRETTRAAPPSAIMQPGVADDIPNLYRQPDGCKSVVQRELTRQQVAFHGHPPAAQYAVDRRLDGCSVPTPVGYHPDAPPAGAADPISKREDAPSNRR